MFFLLTSPDIIYFKFTELKFLSLICVQLQYKSLIWKVKFVICAASVTK